jgi:pimeloyl-ACP methyl ester carboxylesterase
MALRKILISKLIANIVFSAATIGVAHTQAPAVQSGYAPVNGLKMYYEIHGSVRSAGQPLILIHGGLGSSAMFSDIMPQLSKDRQVIAVDLQAHGRMADIDRPLSFESMADDVAALVLHLKIEKVDVMGYSVGGEVALRVAIQHPDLIRRLVVVSATFRRDGRYPEIVAGMTMMGPASAAAMKQTPMYELYARTALCPEGWPVVNTKLATCSGTITTG